MANRRLAPAAEQPGHFAFTPENAEWARGQIEKYPQGRQASAVISLLWKAQEQHGGWLPRAAIEAVAKLLGMPPIRVLEVATFYTMFALEPVGRYWIQLCGTVPCDVCGAKALKDALRARIGPPGHVTPDGSFSWIEVECLGACCNAPVVQINHDYYEDLTPESLNRLLDDLAAGRPVKAGSQAGRRSSEPKDAIRTLTDESLFDGSRIGAWRERFAETHIDGVAVARKDGRTRDEAASTLARAKDEPKPAHPKAGRATESEAADTPAVRATAGETPVKPGDEGRAGGKPGSGDGAAAAALDATDARAVAADRALRTEPPAQPEASGEEPDTVGTRPAGLAAPREGGADDLKRIDGIGPANERRLHELGIFHFAQIAAWTRAETAWISAHLSFPGRVEREDWVGQARGLTEKGRG